MRGSLGGSLLLLVHALLSRPTGPSRRLYHRPDPPTALYYYSTTDAERDSLFPQLQPVLPMIQQLFGIGLACIGCSLITSSLSYASSAARTARPASSSAYTSYPTLCTCRLETLTGASAPSLLKWRQRRREHLSVSLHSPSLLSIYFRQDGPALSRPHQAICCKCIIHPHAIPLLVVITTDPLIETSTVCSHRPQGIRRRRRTTSPLQMDKLRP